jgi:hypothetical protein
VADSKDRLGAALPRCRVARSRVTPAHEHAAISRPVPLAHARAARMVPGTGPPIDQRHPYRGTFARAVDLMSNIQICKNIRLFYMELMWITRAAPSPSTPHSAVSPQTKTLRAMRELVTTYVPLFLSVVAIGVSIWTYVQTVRKGRAKLYLEGLNLFRDPRLKKNSNRWSMGVHNRGPAAARNVLVWLQSATTPPRYGRWTNDYPYPVYPLGTIANDAAQTSSPQRQINPESRQDYEIVLGEETAEGKLNTSLDTKAGGHSYIFIEPDERWRLHYEVTSENAHPVHFTLEIFVESNQVKVSMVDGPRGRPTWPAWWRRGRSQKDG